MKTQEQIIEVIENTWVYGQCLSSKIAEKLEDKNSNLPILDQLLSRLGLLKNYNFNNRPSFEKFELWWRWITNKQKIKHK